MNTGEKTESSGAAIGDLAQVPGGTVEGQSDDPQVQAAILDALPANIAVIDQNGVIIAVNENWRSFAKNNGSLEADFIGKNYWTACESSRGMEAEEAQLMEDSLREVIAGKQESFSIEYPCDSPGGKRWFRVTAAPLKTDRRSGAVVMHMDITERKNLEKQFLRSQRVECIGTLAGGIAHDLNNVLAPILMSIDLLRMYVENPEGLEILDMVEKSTCHGAEMVKQVLSFARGLEGHVVEIQITHIIKDLLRIVEDTFPKNVSISGQLENDLWLIKADPIQIHQVLLNVCLNARDALPEGGHIAVKVANVILDEHHAAMNSEVNGGRYLKIDIEDNGHGIPKDIIDRIFDPFFTTKEMGKGTGLGLSTSLAIIQSHGGFIRAYSDPGMGASFRIYLPAVPEPSVGANDSPEAELVRGEGETVLVVDDEASVRFITKQTLEAFGYKVLLAADGAEAISVYVSHQDEISVVLTDMMMPIMDGPATIQVLRRLKPDLRIIGASGMAASGKVAKALTGGVNHFLPKPYTAEALLKAIRRILEEPSS